MRKFTLLLMVSLFGSLLLEACRSSKEMPKGNHMVDFTPVMNATLYGDGQEGFSYGGIVIRNEKELENFRVKANSVNETLEGIAVDFTKEMLLVYVDRVRGNSGHSWEFELIYETEIRITAEVKHEVSEIAAEVISQPFVIVSTSKSDKEVEFIFNEPLK